MVISDLTFPFILCQNEENESRVFLLKRERKRRKRKER